MAFIPSAVGDQLITTGTNLENTGNKLIDASGKFRSLSSNFSVNSPMLQALNFIKSGCSTIRTALLPIENGLNFTQTTLNSIQVPTIRFSTQTLDIVGIKFTFVSGINLGSARPFQTIATRIKAMADKVGEIRTALSNMVTNLNNLIISFPQIRTEIINGSTDLADTGASLLATGASIKQAGTLMKA